MPRNIGANRANIRSNNGLPIIAGRDVRADRVWEAINSFTPAQLPQTLGWYTAQDLSTITKDGSNNVSAWANKITTESATSVGTAPVYTASAINSLPAINFFPVTVGGLSIADDPKYNWAGLHVFVVAQMVTDTAATATMLGKWTVTGNQREFALNMTSGRTVQGVTSADGSSTTVTAGTTGAVAVGTPIVAEMEWNGTNIQSFRNGTNSSGAAAATIFNGTANIVMGSVSAGTAQGYRGYIGEVVICNAQLTAFNRQRMLSYLSAQWGITVTA